MEHISPLGKSDHGVLVFEVNCYTETKLYDKISYKYDKGDYQAINEYLTLDWKNELRNLDVETQYDILNKHINFAKDKWIPKRRGQPPWKIKGRFPLDRTCLNRKNRKHRRWQRYRENRTDENWRAYCKERNQVRSMTRKLTKDIEKDIAKQAKTNPKKFWRYVNTNTKTKEGFSQLLKPNSNETTSTDEEKAEVFLNHFSNVFTKEPDGQIPQPKAQLYDSPLQSFHISKEMVEKQLLKLQISKSPGPDALHPRLLKEISSSISEPLSIIFNNSLNSMTVPEIWKSANVSAIFKKGDKKMANNYRPISLTSVLCKTMESIIRDQMIAHMKRNLLFSDKQYGFITGRSTTLQLLKVLDKWTEVLDSGGQVDAIYMDFMKAFDKVPHRRLLAKIKSYGFSDPLLGWIEQFLTGRTQRVIVNNIPSSNASVTSGIPQGSVLGPILFILYINDLPDLVLSETYLFADDTKLFRHIIDFKSAEELQGDLNKLQEWSSTWLLKFHPDKCKVLTLGNRSVAHKYTLQVDGISHNLENVSEMKDLGITIDQNLSFENHINEKISKANRIVGLIRRTFIHLDEAIFTQLFKSLVRPHLEYSNATWYPYKKKHILALENVQRRATKLVPKCKDLPYTERLKKLQLPTLMYRRIRGDMIETFKMLKTSDREITPKLTISSSTTRGHYLKLEKPRAEKNVRKYFFTHRIVNLWNKLPKPVIDSPNVRIFEGRLDKFLARYSFKFDTEAQLPFYDM